MIKAVHPDYEEYSALWRVVRDTFKGEPTIKCCGEVYLRKTDGMRQHPRGDQIYEDYVNRSIFYEYPKEIATKNYGLLNKEKATIDIDENPTLELFTEDMDGNKQTAQQFLEDMHKEMLSISRVGYLLDAPDDGDGFNQIPHIVTYKAEKIINWNAEKDGNGGEKLTFVLLDETAMEIKADGSWETKEQYRVLRLNKASVYYTYKIDDQDQLDLSVDYVGEDAVFPALMGNMLDFIPFKFVNLSHTMSSVEEPCSLEICNLSLALYRAEADYRQQLHGQAQETLVTIGRSEEDAKKGTPTGVGAVLALAEGGSAEYIGISGESLAEVRSALENLHSEIKSKGVILVEGAKESGEALEIRMTAKTSKLSIIANTSAKALKEILEMVAKWANVDSEVEVVPNKDFSSSNITAKDILDLQTARLQGVKISERSIHKFAADNGFTEMTFDEELQEMETEEEIPMMGGINERETTEE